MKKGRKETEEGDEPLSVKGLLPGTPYNFSGLSKSGRAFQETDRRTFCFGFLFLS